MKKVLARMVALMMVFSLVLGQSIYAATTYSITVTLSGPDSAYQTQTVKVDSSKYNTLSSTVLMEVVSAMGPDSYRDTLAEKFGGTDMGPVYNDGIAALSGGSAAWAAFLGKYDFVCDDPTLVADYDATFADLKAVGGVTSVSYVGTFGTYTVTVKLNSHTSGGGDSSYTPPKPSESGTVNVNPSTGGSVAVSDTTAPAGSSVSVIADPDDDKMVNYVVVYDENGNKVPLTYEGDGEYSFVMPEGGVTVSVYYRTEPADPDVTGVSAILDTDNHVAFMVGDAAGNFNPTVNITRAEICMIFYRLLRDKNVGELQSFGDVSANAWYADAVGTLAALGIVKGVGTSAFEPNRSITRAEFAAICARFANAVSGSSDFSDTKGHWASKEIATACEYGWIYGYEDGTFAPNKAITRQEAAAIVNRVLYRLSDQIAVDSGEAKTFPDVGEKMWSWYEIAEATTSHGHSFEDDFAHEYWK